MNISLHFFTVMAMIISATILTMCSIIVRFGGWNFFGENTFRPTRFHISIAWYLGLSAVCVFCHVFISAAGNDAPPFLVQLLNCADVWTLTFLPLQSKFLRMERINTLRWIELYTPGVLLFVCTICLWHESHLLFGIQNLVYVYYVALFCVELYRLRRWDRQMMEEFSDLSHKLTTWFRHLTIPAYLLMFLWIPLFYYEDAQWIELIYYIIEIFLVVALSSYALNYEEFDFTPIQDDTTPNPQSSTTDDAPYTMPAWGYKLTYLMEEKKIYRQQSLTSTNLAQQVGVNRTYLSNHIHKIFNSTFYDYINLYRLQEAQELLLTTDDSLETIATQCGFSSRTVFSRIFKLKYGANPSDFRKTASSQPPREEE